MTTMITEKTIYLLVILYTAGSVQCNDVIQQCWSLNMIRPEYKKVDKCGSRHQAEAVQHISKCRPIEKVIELPIPDNNTIQKVLPQYITVKLCGGGCYNSHHSCVSVSQTVRTVPVILSKCGLGEGRCEKECANIQVEEDTECQCQCLQTEKMECDKDRTEKHWFNIHTCRCECEDQKAFRLCKDQGRIWDTDNCICRCPVAAVKFCSTGFTFDHKSTCSCVADEITNSTNSVTDERVERSESTSVTLVSSDNVDIIIIFALAGVSSVFFLVIISLLNTIKTLRNTVTILNKRTTKRLGTECDYQLIAEKNDL